MFSQTSSPPINARAHFVGAFCFCPAKGQEGFRRTKGPERNALRVLFVHWRACPAPGNRMFSQVSRRRSTRTHVLWVRFVFVPRRGREDFGEQKARSETRSGSFLYTGICIQRCCGRMIFAVISDHKIHLLSWKAHIFPKKQGCCKNLPDVLL